MSLIWQEVGQHCLNSCLKLFSAMFLAPPLLIDPAIHKYSNKMTNYTTAVTESGTEQTSMDRVVTHKCIQMTSCIVFLQEITDI